VCSMSVCLSVCRNYIQCALCLFVCLSNRNYIQCALCRFATTCGEAYSAHMLMSHSGKTSGSRERIATTRRDVRMAAPMFCRCGYSSSYGGLVGE